MQKIILVALIPFLIFGCKNASDEKDEIDITNNIDKSVFEEVEVEDIPEPPKELIFNTIEDYALLTTKEELIATFGKENVKNGSSWYAEGTVELKHSIITNPKNKHIIKYLWDERNPKKLSSLEVCYFDWNEDFEVKGTQKIMSACGFYTGMPINDLRKWNGADFNFSGFGWDYEGGVSVMPKSRLSTCPVSIKLGVKSMESMEAFDELYGDQLFNTSNELVKKAPIIVERIYYHLN